MSFTTWQNPFLLNLVPTFDVGNPNGSLGNTDTSILDLSNLLIPNYIDPRTNTICADIINPCTNPPGFITINGSVNIVGDLTTNGLPILNPSALLKDSTLTPISQTSTAATLIGSNTITLTTTSKIAVIVTANFSITVGPSAIVTMYVNINGSSGGTTSQTIVLGSTGLALTVLDRSSSALGPGSYSVEVYAYCDNSIVTVKNIDILSLGNLL